MATRLEQENRAREILHDIVRTYIETGDPVASRTVARRRRRDLSPATIRNVMADLTEDGFLAQPHTSAGRIPTAKAFRSFVGSLEGARLPLSELQRIRAELERAESVEGRVERTSHVLTELTRNIGIAAAIPTSSQTLDQIELLLLTGGRVLMIVVTRDRMVRNKVVALDEEVAQADLDSIRNYVNRNFSGWILVNIRRELTARLAEERAAYDAILRRLTVLYQRGLLDIELVPEVHLEGASYLVGIDLHLTREKLRELFRTLEEKKLILQLLDCFLEQSGDDVAVQVGLEDAIPGMSGLSLIGLSLKLPSGLAAKIAVLGPVRMDYPKVMSAVLHVGQAFRSIPA